MNCTEAETLVAAYADGELQGLRKHLLERHLARCARCTLQHDGTLALRSRLRAEAPYFAAPPGLRERVRAAVAGTPVAAPANVPRERWRWLGGGALAGCAATLLVFVVGTTTLNWTESRELAAEAVATHVHATLGGNLIQVASSDQHTVKPWLSARLDYSPPVKDYASDGFPLLGGRLTKLEGQPTATLVYGYRKHMIDVFVRPDSGTAPPPLRTLRGFNVASERAGGWEWIVVSDAGSDVLGGFARQLAHDSVSQ
jgi:anti-sigma factor RsiW